MLEEKLPSTQATMAWHGAEPDCNQPKVRVDSSRKITQCNKILLRNTLGVRRTKLWYEDGSWRNVLQHRWNHWRASEAVSDKLHLVDGLRVKMGRMVLKYFEGEMTREDGAIAQY